MKNDLRNIESRAESTLRRCLENVPFIQIDNVQKELKEPVGDIQVDFVADLTVSGIKQVLAVEVKMNGQPKMARAAINRLLRWLSSNEGAYGVFMAPYISQQTAEICRQEGVGYCDFAGNCRLVFGSIFIEQRGNPNPLLEKRDLRSLYSPKAARVLRVLLNNPKNNWKIQELANVADVSLGQAANVKKLLDARELIEKREDGFILKEPLSILTEWSQNYDFRKNQTQDLYSLKSIPEIESEISDVCERKNIRYALTGFSGAARFTPAVRYQRVTAFVDAATNQWTDLFEFKVVASGANITLLTPYDEGVYYGSSTQEGSRIVSPVQLYLDLIGFKGRGEEAANAILEEVLKPLW